MIRKIFAAAAVAAFLAGVPAAVVRSALAIGNGGGTTSANGNGSARYFGSTYTSGCMSPRFALIAGPLSKPGPAGRGRRRLAHRRGPDQRPGRRRAVLAAEPAVRREPDAVSQGEEPLSHVLDDIPVLSGNGVHNH